MLGASGSGSHFGSLYAGIVLDLGSVLRWTRLALAGAAGDGRMAPCPEPLFSSMSVEERSACPILLKPIPAGGNYTRRFPCMSFEGDGEKCWSSEEAARRCCGPLSSRTRVVAIHWTAKRR